VNGSHFGKNLAMGNVFTVLDAKARTVNNMVALLLAALFINDGDEGRRGSWRMEVPPRPSTNFMSTNLTTPLLRASSVERSETRVAVPPMWKVRMVKLRAGFADGLRGDDADSFAKLNHAASGEVAAITQGANTAAGFAGEHGTNAHALDARGLHLVSELLGDFLADVDDDRALEVLNLVEGKRGPRCGRGAARLRRRLR